MTKTQQPFVTCIILCGLAVAGLAGACGYQYLTSMTIDRAISEQRQQLAQERRTAAELVKVREESAAIAENIERRPASWTWSDQLPVMMGQVAESVTKGGGAVETMQPAPIIERQQLARFPLRLSLRADLATLTRVLTRVQQAVPTLAVDQLSIRAGQKPGDPLQVEMTVSSFIMLDGRPSAGGAK